MNRALHTIRAAACCVMAGMLCSAPPACADVWDASADFSAQSNPAGAWAYGFKPFDVTGEFRPYASCDNIGGYGPWQWNTDDGTVHHGWITRSSNAEPFQVPWGVWWEASGINMHPGEAGQRPAIRWTSPVAGWVRVALDVGGMEWADCDVQLLANDIPVWSTAIKGFAGTPGTDPREGRNGANPEESTVLDLYVQPGDTIDCTVGYGSDRNWAGDATSVRFTLTTIGDPFGHIAGTVRAAAPDGRPLEGVEVTTVQGGYYTETDSQGRYALQVAPGTYTVQFAKSGYAPQQAVPVTASQGETQALDYVLAQTGSVWDAGADFSQAANPGCVWTYGWRPADIAGSMTPYPYCASLGGLSIQQWFDPSADRGSVSRSYYTDPFLSGTGTWWSGSGINVQPGALGEMPVIRWTSPINGWVSVTAVFRGMSVHGVGADGHILVNGVPVWDSDIEGFAGAPVTGLGRFGSSPVASHSHVVEVGPADTIECVLGWGSDLSSTNDSSGLTFRIASVPDLNGAPVERIGSVQEGATVSLTGKTAVTDGTSFADFYVIEEPDRSSGIRVVGGAGRELVTTGDSVTVWGAVLADADGPYILADAVTSAPGIPLRPVGVTNRNAADLSSLLVRTWGAVTAIDPLRAYCYIDDGSALHDGSGSTGLKVDVSRLSAPMTAALDGLSVGDFVVVTGVAASSGGVPAVRPRSASDLR